MKKEERIKWLKQFVKDNVADAIYEIIFNEGYTEAATLAIMMCEDSEDPSAKLCVKTFKDVIELNNVYGSN